MADKYLNEVGLQATKTWANEKFALKTALDALAAEVEEIVSAGGEPNVIETVKVNGTALVPDAQKAVNVTVPTSTSALTNDGDGDSNFATEDYVEQNGGKIDVIKLNGKAQTITNKEVDLAVPTKLSDLTNDGDGTTGSTFPTTAEMQTAIESAVVGALKPKGSIAFANLPALTAANLNTMYDITDSFTTTADFTEGAGHSYPAGTEVAIINAGTDANPVYKYSVMVGIHDMAAYWTNESGKRNSLIAMTVAEVNAILNA